MLRLVKLIVIPVAGIAGVQVATPPPHGGAWGAPRASKVRPPMYLSSLEGVPFRAQARKVIKGVGEVAGQLIKWEAERAGKAKVAAQGAHPDTEYWCGQDVIALLKQIKQREDLKSTDSIDEVKRNIIFFLKSGTRDEDKIQNVFSDLEEKISEEQAEAFKTYINQIFIKTTLLLPYQKIVCRTEWWGSENAELKRVFGKLQQSMGLISNVCVGSVSTVAATIPKILKQVEFNQLQDIHDCVSPLLATNWNILNTVVWNQLGRIQDIAKFLQKHLDDKDGGKKMDTFNLESIHDIVVFLATYLQDKKLKDFKGLDELTTYLEPFQQNLEERACKGYDKQLMDIIHRLTENTWIMKQ